MMNLLRPEGSRRSVSDVQPERTKQRLARLPFSSHPNSSGFQFSSGFIFLPAATSVLYSPSPDPVVRSLGDFPLYCDSPRSSSQLSFRRLCGGVYERSHSCIGRFFQRFATHPSFLDIHRLVVTADRSRLHPNKGWSPSFDPSRILFRSAAVALCASDRPSLRKLARHRPLGPPSIKNTSPFS